MLRRRGFGALADADERYYLAAWRHFLGGAEPAEAVRAGLETLRLGIKVAEE
jgi:hypothetical protein